MPLDRLTEDDLQGLLEHVKVQMDPAFNKTLQAELQARARALRASAESSSRPIRRAQLEQTVTHAVVSHDQKPPGKWGLGWFNTINVLSSAVLAVAALALVFLVLVRPMLDDKATELDITSAPPTGLIQVPADVTPTTIKIATTLLPDTPTPLPTELPVSTSTLVPTPTPLPTELPISTSTLVPTLTPLPTETDLPTPTPLATLTPGNTSTPLATPAPVVTITCSWTQVTGYVEQTAPYVRLTVSVSSPTIQEIGSAVASVQPDGSYSVTVTYSALPAGTHLIGGYGEWDGTWWLRPATTFGSDCQP